MHRKYKHLFFDLDRTLYDFDSNNKQTLLNLFTQYKLESKGVENFEAFFQTYQSINLSLWQQYMNKEITKEFLNYTRFHKTLNYYNITNGLASTFAAEYISQSPSQTRVMPGTHEILEYLFPEYIMHIITNGFEEIQFEKLSRSKLQGYFTKVITSEKAGALKPSEAIFRYAMQVTGANPQESIIIGDDPVADIMGGKSFGMDQVWLCNTGESSEIIPTYSISKLLDLKDIL